MRKIIFLFLTLIPASNIYGQGNVDGKIDSLLKVLKGAKGDVARVDALNALAFEFRSSDPDTAVHFSNEALKLADKVNYEIGKADAFLWKGAALIYLGEYAEALKISQEALQICDQSLSSGRAKDASKILQKKAWALTNMGNAYWYQGDFRDALKNHLASLNISEEIQDKETIGISFNYIGDAYLSLGSYPEALKNYLTGLKISEEARDTSSIGNAYNDIGIVYIRQSDYQQALKYHLLALSIRKEIKNRRGVAGSYFNIAVIYYYTGNYPEALRNNLASLKIYEEIGDKRGIANVNNNLGNIYMEQENYAEALKYYLACLKAREELGNKSGMATVYGNIGNIYKKQGKYAEALSKALASLRICEQVGDKSGMATAYSYIGSVYARQNKYPEALMNYFTYLEIGQDIGDTFAISSAYYNIATVYGWQKKNSEASSYMNKSLLLAKDMGNLDLMKDGYEGLAEFDSAQGNFKQALEHFKLHVALKDSLFNEENTKKLVQTQMQYEFDKKESLAKVEQEKKDAIASKELQKQKLIRNGFVGGFTVVLLFAGIFFTQRNTIKKGKKRSDELLLNILPSEVAEELKLNGSSEAKQFDEVTVMFTDFKDFTLLSEKLSPVELVSQIDYCFKAFDRIMEKYNIEKIKTIGDSYMAAGGLHFRNKTNAADVVKAALEIQEFMERDAQRRRSEGKEILEIRIGVHSGTVVAGIVGIKKFAYDIWGDTVNIASRMESSSEAGKVNISGTTYELVKDEFNCTYRGKIHAKNKGEIDMYFVEQNDR